MASWVPLTLPLSRGGAGPSMAQWGPPGHLVARGDRRRSGSGTITRVTTTPAEFRCSAASLLDEETMAGTAPTESTWLLVEYAGPWGRKAVAESRLPDDVRTFLGALEGVRVQLIRRHGGVSGPGVRVFVVQMGDPDGPRVWTSVLDRAEALLDLDVAALGTGAGLAAHDAPLWLVCTNGRRDLCCAEHGRPIAAALSARWPESTWETTHLGGHRFAGTMLALPAGVVLGRLDADSAVQACDELATGRLPAGVTRGRAGVAEVAQVADLHLRRELGLDRVADVTVRAVEGDVVTLDVPGATYAVRVARTRGEPRRHSCADLKLKSGDVYDVVSWGRQDA